MSSSESSDEDSLPSAQPRDIIPDTQELLAETGAEPLSEFTTANEDEDGLPNSEDSSDSSEHGRLKQREAMAFRRQNAQERDVFTSIERIRARDLSVHLYNAFRLHERAKRLRAESAKEPWEPRPDWTTWPHPVDQVPREREEEQYLWDRAWTFCGKPNVSSRAALQDHLIAAASRRARGTFQRRASNSNSETADASGIPAEDPDDDDTDDASDTHSGPQTWKAELSTNIRRPSEVAKQGVGNKTLKAGKQPVSTPQITNPRIDSSSEVKVQQAGPSLGSFSATGGSAQPPIKTFLVEEAELYPGPLTDDDQVRSLLSQPVCHSLTMFDQLLAAMHHSRASHVRRPRKRRESKQAPKLFSVSYSTATTESLVEAHEMAQNNHVRRDIASLQKWDWSNVLGFAALAGYDPEVIKRTRARCERLFGQRMDFVTSVVGTREVPAEAGPGATATSSTGDLLMADADANAQSQHPAKGSDRPDTHSNVESGADNVRSRRERDAVHHQKLPTHEAARRRFEPTPQDGLHLDGFLETIEVPLQRTKPPRLPHWWRRAAPLEMPEAEPDPEPEVSDDEDVSMAEEEPSELNAQNLGPNGGRSQPVGEDQDFFPIDPALLDPSLNASAPAPTAAPDEAATHAPAPSAPASPPAAQFPAGPIEYEFIEYVPSDDEPMPTSLAKRRAVAREALSIIEYVPPGHTPPPKPPPKRPPRKRKRKKGDTDADATAPAASASAAAGPSTIIEPSTQPANPVQQSNDSTAPPPDQKPRKLYTKKKLFGPHKRKGRPPKPKVPEPPKVPKPPPVHLPVYGPPAPKRLKPTRYARTQEQLDIWRAKGFVPMDDDPA